MVLPVTGVTAHFTNALSILGGQALLRDRAGALRPRLPLATRSATSARNAPVAQLDRALPSEGKGHTFESCRVRQSSWHNPPHTVRFMPFMRLTIALLVAGLLAPAVPAIAQTRDLKALGKKLDAPVTKPTSRGTGMKPCPEYGAGFYRLAGSDTCVRVSGSVGVDIGTSNVRR